MTIQVTAIANRINSVFKPKPTIKENATDAAIFGLATAAFTGATSGIAARAVNKKNMYFSGNSVASLKEQIKKAKNQNLGQEAIGQLKANLKGIKKLVNKASLETAGIIALGSVAIGAAITIVRKALNNNAQKMLDKTQAESPAADKQ